MKNYYQIRDKGRGMPLFIGRILLLCLLLTSNLSKALANEALLSLQSTHVTINLINKPLSALFKTLEKESEYVFFFKDDVLKNQNNVTVKANNESVVSILEKVLSHRNLGYTVKGRQVVIVNLADAKKADKETDNSSANYKINGKVVDTNGDPLPGVNITLQGMKTGTITNLNGAFSLEVKSGQRVLLIASYIGFATKEIWVNEKTGFLKIELKESAASLNEVVVVGYGTQKKLNLTGAVSTTSGDILENRPISNIAQGLQGMVPNHSTAVSLTKRQKSIYVVILP